MAYGGWVEGRKGFRSVDVGVDRVDGVCCLTGALVALVSRSLRVS